MAKDTTVLTSQVELKAETHEKTMGSKTIKTPAENEGHEWCHLPDSNQ